MPEAHQAALLLQHALVVAMLVVAPIWDRRATRELKTSTDPAVKRRYYRITCLVLWTCAVVACVATGGYGQIAGLARSPGDAPWLPGHGRTAPFITGAIIGIVFVLLLPAAIALRSPKARARSAQAFRRLAFFLPVTAAERAWWVAVSVTAGVCEEIIFRGFLLRYLHAGPWHLTLGAAVIIAALIFGLQHLYQGLAGVIQTALIGVLFSLIYLVTGTLLVPMLLHCMMDLRVLLLIEPLPERAAA
jgi:membrane protease YdiL (CAAX protease family)